MISPDLRRFYSEVKLSTLTTEYWAGSQKGVTMAHCTIKGIFKEDSQKALKTALSMGAWGGCSYSTWKSIPEKDGDISFELFGRAPFDKLHKIAKAICEEGKDYTVSISEWELPLG